MTDTGFNWELNALGGLISCTATLTGDNAVLAGAIAAVDDPVVTTTAVETTTTCIFYS
jgi:hypothetical protein